MKVEYMSTNLVDIYWPKGILLAFVEASFLAVAITSL